MRLIGQFNNKKQAQEFSFFLTREGIANQCEIHTNTDWGSANYGDVECRIWVTDEEQVERAVQLFQEFTNHPNDPRFYGHGASVSAQEQEELGNFAQQQLQDGKLSFPSRMKLPLKKGMAWESQSMGPMTWLIILVCGFLFLWGQSTTPKTPATLPTNLPLTPLTEPEINKRLIYDYPYAFEIIDKMVSLYGIEKAEDPSQLPPAGAYLFEEYLHTPYWEGIYTLLLIHFIEPASEQLQTIASAPLFEKIREGEVWRLISPCFLHANFIHIFFNLLWLVILGKQMESRLGGGRYLLFILLTGIFSNTLQYLMSGANFIGISGVLCAMFTFIWVRQKNAAWEGYDLQPSTIAFMTFFILAMLSIQLVSFFLEISMKVSISPGIANTAHLSGAFIGALLGRLKFFEWNTHQP